MKTNPATGFPPGDRRSPAPLLLLAFATAACAAPRTSANYSVTAETADAGGKRTSSANYTNDGSAGGIAGVSAVASPAETAKQGFVAQLYEATGLTLTAATTRVNEGATDQLAAWQTLDDSTFLAVPAASVAWSVVSGPLSDIAAAGLATAGPVYQNTAATAQGSYLGNLGTLGLTVVNVNLDNFGAYAGDAVDDAWQVQFFGQPPNALAGPTADPDGDGQTNHFEFTAGLVPTDPVSRFLLRIENVPGQPGQKSLIFSPRFTDRTYAVTSSTSLAAGSFGPLESSTVLDNGPERTVTDLGATGAAKLYQVEITKP